MKRILFLFFVLIIPCFCFGQTCVVQNYLGWGYPVTFVLTPGPIGSVTVVGVLPAGTNLIGGVSLIGPLSPSGVSLLTGNANIGIVAFQAGQTVSVGNISLAAGSTILDNNLLALTSPTPTTYGNVKSYSAGPVTDIVSSGGVSLLTGSANIGSVAFQAGQTVSVGNISLAAGSTILDNNLLALTSPTPTTYLNVKNYSAGPATNVISNGGVSLLTNTANIGAVSFQAGQTLSIGSPTNVGVTFMATPSDIVFNGCVTGVSAGVSTVGTKVTVNSSSNSCFNVMAAAVSNTGGSGAVDWAYYYQASPNYTAGTSFAGVTCSGSAATAQLSVTIPLAQSCYASIWAITSAATTGVCWMGLH